MKRIKPPNIKRLRIMVARNFNGIDNCCGTDSLRQVCRECNIRVNLMNWALNSLARKFATKKKSINFVLKIYWKEEDDRLTFGMQARTTREKLTLDIPPETVYAARDWQDKIIQSARKSDKKK